MDLEAEVTADLLRRLARVEGQVRGVQAMIRDGRECHEIVAQLSAAGRALDQVGFKMLAANLQSGLDPDEVERLFLRLA